MTLRAMAAIRASSDDLTDRPSGNQRVVRFRSVRPDLAPQVPDVGLNHIGGAVEVVAPDQVKQLGLGEDWPALRINTSSSVNSRADSALVRPATET